MFCLLGLGQFGLTILVLFCIFVLLPIYFVPSYIAFKKQKLQKTAIVVLNVFLGWTFLGWVVALVWACMEDGTSTAENRQDYSPEKITKKTIVTASISLIAVVTFIYLSWIFRGERWNQSEIDYQLSNYTRAIEYLPEGFQDLEKDEENENILELIEVKIKIAGDCLTKGLELQNNTAKVFWSNALDVIANGARDPGAALRAQILKDRGFSAYIQAAQSENYEEQARWEIEGSRSSSQAKQFRPIVDAIYKLIELRAKGWELSSDIFDNPHFDSFSRSIYMADALCNRQALSIQNDLSLSKRDRDNRVTELAKRMAKSEIRKRVSIAETGISDRPTISPKKPQAR